MSDWQYFLFFTAQSIKFNRKFCHACSYHFLTTSLFLWIIYPYLLLLNYIYFSLKSLFIYYNFCSLLFTSIKYLFTFQFNRFLFIFLLNLFILIYITLLKVAVNSYLTYLMFISNTLSLKLPISFILFLFFFPWHSCSPYLLEIWNTERFILVATRWLHLFEPTVHRQYTVSSRWILIRESLFRLLFVCIMSLFFVLLSV